MGIRCCAGSENISEWQNNLHGQYRVAIFIFWYQHGFAFKAAGKGGGLGMREKGVERHLAVRFESCFELMPCHTRFYLDLSVPCVYLKDPVHSGHVNNYATLPGNG